MNPGDGIVWVQNRQSVSEQPARYCVPDHSAIGHLQIERHNQATGLRSATLFSVLRATDERKIVGGGSIERRRIRHFQIRIAFIRLTQVAGEFTDCHLLSLERMTLIAASARIHPDAVIGEGCRIGEFCVIEQDVVLGAGCTLEPYVYVKRWTTLGEENEISAGTVLGTDPLDKGFQGDRSYLRIGHRNKIREHFTISRGTKPEAETVIGDGNYVMTSGHIAHDCRIGNETVISSCSGF